MNEHITQITNFIDLVISVVESNIDLDAKTFQDFKGHMEKGSDVLRAWKGEGASNEAVVVEEETKEHNVAHRPPALKPPITQKSPTVEGPKQVKPADMRRSAPPPKPSFLKSYK